MKRDHYLLLDDRIIAGRVNAALKVGRVTKHAANPMFVEDRPWEVAYNNGYPDVILDPDDGLYKCWNNTWVIERAYEATPPKKRILGTWPKVYGSLHGRGARRLTGTVYAVSRDGIKWQKPVLNTIDFKGSRRNNLVMRDAHGAGVFRDDHEVDPRKRYKMFFRWDRSGGHRMAVAFSPDGIHWRRRACPEIVAQGDTHNNALWAPTLGKYVGITRLWVRTKTRRVRQVGRTISDDFLNWSKVRVVLEGLDDDLQVYCMPVCYYAGLYLGMATIFELSSDRAWTELAWSPDTVRWHRVDPGQPLIPCNARYGTYDWGCAYPSRPVFLDDEIRIYYMGSYGLHTDWRRGGLCLAKLRPDGFAGYEPADQRKEAVVHTRPVRLCADLCLTADISRGGYVTVTALDAASRAVAESQPMRQTVTRSPVQWMNEGPGIGRRVRLEFRIRKAKLYSFSVGSQDSEATT